jgi:23S rRNA (uridine2552-2'-O)-methyltransferase
VTKQWYSKHIKDPFVKLANKEGLRSRAAYKLLEIQKKRQLIHSGDKVLDLGSAPGAWSEALVKMVGSSGMVVSCDLLDMEPIRGVYFVKGDFLREETLDEIQSACGKFDVIVSDMAPNLTGTPVVDQANMLKLVKQAIVFAKIHLNVGGGLLVKCFSGSQFEEGNLLFKENFGRVKVFKPDASKQASKEIYLIGQEFKV